MPHSLSNAVMDNGAVMDLSYDQLRVMTAMTPALEFTIPCGDWNGYVGHTSSGYRLVHGDTCVWHAMVRGSSHRRCTGI